MKLSEKAHFRILRLIEDRPEISQRELAGILGVSLGKTHYLLKALLDKGLVKMGNFRRHDNKLAYVYKLTPSGIAAKLSLTREFLDHKEAEYLALHSEIAQLRQELQASTEGEKVVNSEAWYVARTKPRQEAVANGNLQRQGFATYLPKLKVLKRIRREQVLRMEPMFPQYLFFRPAHAQHSIAPVRSTIGVLNIVRFGHQPALLSPEKYEAISALEARQHDSSIEELSAIQPGSRVVVVDGPLAGMEGLVSAVSAKRVEVLMHLLGSDTKVNLALASLEAAR